MKRAVARYEKDRHGERYCFTKSNNKRFFLLSEFLTFEIGFSERMDFSGWLLFDSSEFATGYSIELCRDEDDPNEIWMYDPDDFKENLAFKIMKDDLADAIDRWKKLIKQRPKEIIITQEGNTGKIMLEGRNEVVFEECAFYLNDEKKYARSRSSCDALYFLATFLVHDFSRTSYVSLFGFKKWINDDQEDSFFENRLLVRKEDENIVINFDPEHSKSFFVIEKDKLIEIIDNFNEFSEANVRKFVITDKNGEFVFDKDIWERRFL